jgi:hypothetical protein
LIVVVLPEPETPERTSKNGVCMFCFSTLLFVFLRSYLLGGIL